MSTEPNSTEDSVELERRLLDLVPSGESVGNITLLDQLQWPEATYWRVRNLLIDSGRLTKGRGRGGSVRKVTSPTTTATPSESESRTTEADLYVPVLRTIKSHWVKDYRIRDFVAEVTAYQGRRETGGKWSRPDITLASYNTYPFVPGKHFDVHTFEVKTFDQLDVTAVYEALAHRRAAHYSYVIVYQPMERADDSILEDIAMEADHHEIGLIKIVDPSDYNTWDSIVEPIRNDADPADLNDFLAAQTSTEFKDQITHWCR